MNRYRWAGFVAAVLLAFFGLSAHAQQTARPLGSTTAPYGFYEYLPFGYDSADLAKRWPVVIFLHGQNELGNGTYELAKVLNAGVPYNIHHGTHYPFIAISPQSPPNWWQSGTIDQMVEYVKANYRIDEDRLYVTGLSMGGGGTWSYARLRPGKLAAIMPICGADTGYYGPALVNVPTWAFHSWGDFKVSANNTVQWGNHIAGARSGEPPTDMIANYPGGNLSYSGPPGPYNTSNLDRTANYDLVTKNWIWKDGAVNVPGSHPVVTLFRDTAHNSWGRAYGNKKAWEWLLGQTRFGASNKAPVVQITAPGSNITLDDPASITIKATVTDIDSAVDLVEFFVGHVKLGEDNVAPHEFVWSDVPDGVHWITVKATDALGAVSAAVVKITVISSNVELIVPAGAGPATGNSGPFPLQQAFDQDPPATLNAVDAPVGGSGGLDAPYYANRHGYIDFGPNWASIRITSTWTRYRKWSNGAQTPYAEAWWDDDTDNVNDSGLVETGINFNSATGLATGDTEPWVRDRDFSTAPIAPKAQFLILRSPATMTNRAKEYAIVGTR